MIITYHGLSAVRIQQGDFTIALNPISKEGSEKASTFGSDLVIVSTDNPDTNGVENATRGDKVPFVIDGPGEYEVKEVMIKGFPSRTSYGGVEKLHTVYRLVMDDISILFLGVVGDFVMSPEIKGEIDTVDIVIVPAGGNGALGGKDACKLAMSFEPKIIIPILTTGSDKKIVTEFMREAGSDATGGEEKLVLKRKDIADKNGEVMLLKAVN